MSKPVFVGVDDGHYSIKLIGDNKEMITIPSRAAQGRQILSFNDDDDGFYETEGMQFTVNANLENYEDTRFMEYPKSNLNRVLIHAALLKAGYGGRNVSIATGLPVSYYYLRSGEKNEALIEGKVQSLYKPVKSSSRPTANIVSNIATTEAIAAYFDQLMDMDGNEVPDSDEFAQSTVGVIDVGGKTTDCAVLLPNESDGGVTVSSDRSGSNDMGVLVLNGAIESLLRSKFDLDNVPPRMVEAAIRTGKVKISGTAIDISDIVLGEKVKLTDKIMAGVRTKIGTGRDLEQILFVGGGSIVLRDQLQAHFPNARFPERPEFANARGMFKIAKYIFGSED